MKYLILTLCIFFCGCFPTQKDFDAENTKNKKFADKIGIVDLHCDNDTNRNICIGFMNYNKNITVKFFCHDFDYYCSIRVIE